MRTDDKTKIGTARLLPLGRFLAPALAMLVLVSVPAPAHAGIEREAPAAARRANGEAEWEVTLEKLRGICRVEAFLACMRWDRRTCDGKVRASIEAGIETAAPQADMLEERLRKLPGVVDGFYVGATMGELLKASGPRLNNCLPDPRQL